MSTPVKHSITIIQGTTQHVPLVRQYVEYAVKSMDCGGGYVDACTGAPVPPGDLRDEDYTGCTAQEFEQSSLNGQACLVPQHRAVGCLLQTPSDQTIQP